MKMRQVRKRGHVEDTVEKQKCGHSEKQPHCKTEAQSRYGSCAFQCWISLKNKLIRGLKKTFIQQYSQPHDSQNVVDTTQKFTNQ